MSNYPPRLAAGDIKYIALEGGGGKGNAFIGALESLAHASLRVIRHSNYRLANILGVAGASAGAITSLFLACGFTPLELKTITELEDFNAFFDGPNPGRVFRIGGFQDDRTPTPEMVALAALVAETLALLKDMDVRRLAAYVASHVHVNDIVRHLRELRELIDSLPSGSDPVETARRIEAVIERLTRLGIDDTVDALRAVQEILTVIPADAWGHLLQMCFRYGELAGLSMGAMWSSAVFSQLDRFIGLLRDLLPNATYQQLLNRGLQDTAAAFVRDFGVLTGEEIYKFFRRWLAVARWRVNAPARYESYLTAAGNDLPTCFRQLKTVVEAGTDTDLARYRDENMTFEAFEREFQIKFAVTGSNLETLTSHVFSGATTPRFYVVDAVRLSMSLPYCLFKPLIIRENDPGLRRVIGSGESARERDPVSGNRERHPLIGVWVDGGLFNNIPSHVFDREAGGGETLALRLDSSYQTLPSGVTTISDYYRRFPGGVLFGTGEALATRSYDNKYRSIALDTGNLNLLSFSPSAADAAAVRRSAIEYVFRYFDTAVPGDL